MEPLLSLTWNDSRSTARGYLVIDTLIRGVAGGGCRMRAGCSLDEVTRLAESMSSKFALFDVPIGGAKAGVDYDPGAADADEVLIRFFSAITPYLRDSYITGPDMGTNEDQILSTLRRLGIPSPGHAAIARWGLKPETEEALNRALALQVDGIPLDGFLAGYGVAVCAQEALARRGIPIRQARIALQGFGSVGGAAAKYLEKEGATIVAIADIKGTVACREGLAVEQLLKARNAFGVVDRTQLSDHCVLLDDRGWITEPSDVLIPAAVTDAIDAAKVEWVRSAIIVEGATLPLTAQAEEMLHRRGVTVIPDFLANSAFAYILGALLLGDVGPDLDAIMALAAARLRERVHRVLDGAERGVLPREQVVAMSRGNMVRLGSTPVRPPRSPQVQITSMLPDTIGDQLMVCLGYDYANDSPEARAEKERSFGSGCVAKRAYCAATMPDGFKVKLAYDEAGHAVGQIEYLPIEIALNRVTGRGLTFIDCVWVPTANQRQGIGTALLNACVEDAKTKHKGIAVLAYEGIDYMPAGFFLKRGFEVVEQEGPCNLLWKHWTAAEAPRFIQRRYKPKLVKGSVVIDLFWNGQCPYSGRMLDRVRRVAREMQDRVVLNETETNSRARVRRYGLADGFFVNGKMVAWYSQSEEEIRRAIENALGR